MAKSNDSERSKKPDTSAARRKGGSGSRPAVGRASAAAQASSAASRNGGSGRASERLRGGERGRTSSAAVQTAPAMTASAVFSADELRKWRELLQQRRGEIAGDIGSLEKDAMEAEDGHTTPNHIAERGSDAELQDVSLNIAGDEKALIWQIDRALRKIDTSRPLPFGLCEHTRQPIQRNRLQLLPWTPLSIEGATYMETSGLTLQDMLLDD